MIFIQFLTFAVGLILLVKGADFLVSGGSSIAQRLKIPQIVIGLTIISLGTSAPEIIVNLIASIDGKSDIVIGNVLGSNIVNILLGLGISSIILPLTAKNNTIWKEIPFVLLATIVLIILSNDGAINNSEDILTRGDGLILLCFFLIFIVYIISISFEGKIEVAIKEMNLIKAILFVLLGVAGLFFGGKFLVDSAIEIAKFLNVSEAVIGFTIVAVGTSLPEIVTSLFAVYKKNSDLAVGNVVGSNIMNIFLVLGLSSVISPIEYKTEYNEDLFFLTLISTILFIYMFTGKKRTLDKWEGILFVIFYLVYFIRFFI